MKKFTVVLGVSLIVLFSMFFVVEAATFDVDFNDWREEFGHWATNSDGSQTRNITVVDPGDYEGLSRLWWDFNVESVFPSGLPISLEFEYMFISDLENPSSYSDAFLYLFDPRQGFSLWNTSQTGSGKIIIDGSEFEKFFSFEGDLSFAFEVRVHPAPGEFSSGETRSCALAVSNMKFNLVPIPSALLLLGSGLIGLVGLRRKLKR